MNSLRELHLTNGKHWQDFTDKLVVGGVENKTIVDENK